MSNSEMRVKKKKWVKNTIILFRKLAILRKVNKICRTRMLRMAVVLKYYLRVLKTHPWKTQAMTTGILMGSGDVICQIVVEKKSFRNLESKRIIRFALLGTFYVGPLLRTWYLALEKICGVAGSMVGLQKMMLDQVCFAPCFLCSFIVISAGLQRQSWVSIQAKLKQDYFEVLKTNYMVWPMAQLVTFYIIPFQHRILFVSLIALFWNSYLALKSNRMEPLEKS